MGLFSKKRENNKLQEQGKKKIGISELSEDTLMNVAGGQSYHNQEDQKANEDFIKSLTNP